MRCRDVRVILPDPAFLIFEIWYALDERDVCQRAIRHSDQYEGIPRHSPERVRELILREHKRNIARSASAHAAFEFRKGILARLWDATASELFGEVI